MECPGIGIIPHDCAGKVAAQHISAWATDNLAEEDRARFIETVETDILGLHEGNYARYQIRPSEFAAWRKVWERRSTRKASGR